MSVELTSSSTGPAGAPPIVLCPALGTTSEVWRHQVSALATGYRVILHDHRGHGRSPCPPGPYRIGELVDDLLRLLDRLRIERTHVAGLSLGGQVAGHLAATAPDRVLSLALIGTAPRFGTAQAWIERAAAVRAGGLPAVADAVLARWFTPDFATGQREPAEWARVLMSTPAEGYAACCDALADADLVPMLDRIIAPTTIVVGADDPAVPMAEAERLAAGLPDGRLEVVPDAAHLPTIEQPEAVSRLLLAHLTRANVHTSIQQPHRRAVGDR